jgi:hypothetical protein
MFDRQPVKKNCDGRSGALKTCITVNVFYSLYTEMFFKMYLHKKFIIWFILTDCLSGNLRASMLLSVKHLETTTSASTIWFFYALLEEELLSKCLTNSNMNTFKICLKHNRIGALKICLTDSLSRKIVMYRNLKLNVFITLLLKCYSNVKSFISSPNKVGVL